MIIGSTAARFHGLMDREPLDLDSFYKEGEEKLSGDSHSLPVEIYEAIDTVDGYISKDHLYTLKCSHLQWDVKWEKTKRDILYYKHKGCKIDLSLYKVLVEYWKGVHGDKSFLNLKKGKEDFFNDHVNYLYDHDYLHEVVADGFGREPLYNKCLKEGESVLTCPVKFNKMSFEEQIGMFREEIAVIAFERWVVFGKISWMKAHSMSVKKTITNLTKGWASDFLVMHLEEFVKPDYKYYQNLMKLKEK